jgi:hypothetical protein
LAAAANLEENSPKDQMLAAPLDEAEGGDVPEAGGAAVAEDDLVAVGQAEQVVQARPQPPTTDLTAFWRWLVPR